MKWQVNFVGSSGIQGVEMDPSWKRRNNAAQTDKLLPLPGREPHQIQENHFVLAICLAVMSAVASAAPSYAADNDCGPGAVRTGNIFANTINGTVGNDVIRGLGGNDKLRGGPCDDKIYGGPGNDKIDGGPGWDICEGGAGADVFVNCEVVVP